MHKFFGQGALLGAGSTAVITVAVVWGLEYATRVHWRWWWRRQWMWLRTRMQQTTSIFTTVQFLGTNLMEKGKRLHYSTMVPEGLVRMTMNMSSSLIFTPPPFQPPRVWLSAQEAMGINHILEMASDHLSLGQNKLALHALTVYRFQWLYCQHCHWFVFFLQKKSKNSNSLLYWYWLTSCSWWKKIICMTGKNKREVTFLSLQPISEILVSTLWPIFIHT